MSVREINFHSEMWSCHLSVLSNFSSGESAHLDAVPDVENTNSFSVGKEMSHLNSLCNVNVPETGLGM